MPPRGARPGFKRGRNNLPYWIASQVVRDHKNYPDPCIPLPADATDEAIAELCRDHTAALTAWIEKRTKEEAEAREKEAQGEPAPLALPAWDGTMKTACQYYQRHPLSRFHKVKGNTRRTYTTSLNLIELTVGKRVIRNLTVLDVQHWYDEWRKPDPDAAGGPERIDRAYDAVSMAKTVLRFCAAALKNPAHKAACKALIDDLKNAGSLVNFEKGGAREQEMTYTHAAAFIRTSLDLGQRSVIPQDRALYMALGVAAQFELLLRQKDIIGERPKNARDLEKAIRLGASAINYGGETWVGFFTWENIPGWRWRMKTSKSKYRAAAEFDLANHGLLLPLLEAVPREQRSGAIVKGEHGFAVQERSYRKWFRQIAQVARIPDEVWNMDSRAGGATEAEESGVSIELIRDALTHSEKSTTLRYIRRRGAKIAEVAEARKAKRAADGEQGGA